MLHSPTELICKPGKQIKVHRGSLCAQNVSLSTVCDQNFLGVVGMWVRWHSLLWCDLTSFFISYNLPANTQGTNSSSRFLCCGKCTTIHSVVQIISGSSFSVLCPVCGYTQ